MDSIVYPRNLTKNIYDLIGSSFSKKDFVKINTLKQNMCIYDSFLLDVYKNYQEESDVEKLNNIREDFIKEFREYLVSDSQTSNQTIYDRIFQAYQMIDMKDIYMLKSTEDSFNIFDLIIVKKDFSENQGKIKGYKLFPDRVKKIFSPVSNFFNLISLEFLKEIIEQRIIRKSHIDRIKKLKFLDEDPAEIEKIEEILSFMDKKENNLDIVSMYNSINLKDCEDQDLLLKLVSETLDINIFLCRGWNTEITVLKDFYKSGDNPYIIIFKAEGKKSITGLNVEKYYEAGGIKTEEGIKTILSVDEKDVISDLKNIFKNNIDSYFLDKYSKYLKNIEQKSNLENLEDYYEESSESDSESDSSDEEDKKETQKYNNIPGFIRGYTRHELETLLHLFVNPDYDYSDIDKEDMELQYKNYLEGTQGE